MCKLLTTIIHMVSVPQQFCCLKYLYTFVFTQLEDLKTYFSNAKLYAPTRGHKSNRLHCNPNCIEIGNQMLIKNNSAKFDIKERCTPLMLPRQRQNIHFLNPHVIIVGNYIYLGFFPSMSRIVLIQSK